MPGFSNSLISVTASAADDAWAVGILSAGGASSQTLVLHWNGRAWISVPDVPEGQLTGLAATSTSVWVAGSQNNHGLLTLRRSAACAP